MFKRTSRELALTAIIAGLYAVLSLAVLPLSSGAIQIRISEGLTILPLLMPQAIWGVAIGCMISNIMCGCAIFDVVFGSIITFISAIFTYQVGKTMKNKKLKFFVGGLFPVILNSFLLPLIWFFANGMLEYLYIVQVAFLMVGEGVSVYGVGFLIYRGAKKYLEVFEPKCNNKNCINNNNDTHNV